MKAMGGTDLKKAAIVNVREFAEMLKGKKLAGNWDASGKIDVVSYDSNKISYQSDNAGEGFAVFSEMYYPKGWNVYLDGKPAQHFRVDYTLRGMFVPAGSHRIEFRFEPQVVVRGGIVSLWSSIGIVLLLAGGVYFESREKKA
jgi:uncharacterized membrane protein YfhO